MMQASASGSWVVLLSMFHAAFVLVAALGVLFFVIWAIKHLSAPKMKTLWIWLLVIGIVGSVVTCPILLGHQSSFGGRGMFMWGKHAMSQDCKMMKGNMEQMDDMGMMKGNMEQMEQMDDMEKMEDTDVLEEN